MKLPKLITITKQKRRIYPIKLVINNRKLDELILDPHYEKKHGNYLTDEIIYNFALELNQKKVIIEDRKKPYDYFSHWPLFREWRAYKLIGCLEDDKNYLGIIDCYRRRKYDKKK